MDEPAPPFFDPAAVGRLYLERAALVAEAAEERGRSHPAPPAAEDSLRIAVLAVDAQVAFCHPEASLFVPGAVEDVGRAIAWLYRNLTRITTLFLTLDSHSARQVFHPAAWLDAEGRHPAPFTVISSRDLREGRFVPVLTDERIPDMRAACIEYCEALEGAGRHALTIWPYHALLGGASHALVPALMEAVLYHSLVRRADPVFEIKGRSPLTESYSALSPEVRSLQGVPLGGFSCSLFEALMAHDRVYVFGEAKSHCVLETLRDLRRECEERDPGLLRRLYVLEDAMSPVAPPPLDPLPEALDFPRIAARAVDDLRRAGMHVVRTSDPLDVAVAR